MSAKKGRPTNDPKCIPIHCRITNKTNEILSEYCRQENITKSEGITKGINKLKMDIKK